MNWTLGVLSCLFGWFLTLLAWSALWVCFSVFLDFVWPCHHWSVSGLLFFIFPIVNSTSTLFSLTVAPIGAGCLCITRANSILALISASQSRQSCEVLGFSVFWAFWDWSVTLALFFRLLECSGALFDWLWPSSFGFLPVSIDFTF